MTRFYLAAFYFISISMIGVDLAYLPLYAKKLGFTPFEVAAISASFFICNIAVVIPWAYVSDRLNRHKHIVTIGLGISLIASFIFPFFKSFIPAAIILYIYAVLQMGTYPQVEELTISTARTNNFNYGTIRAIGSIGFFATTTLFGMLVDKFTANVVPIIYIVFTLFQFLVSLKLPHPPPVEHEKPKAKEVLKLIFSEKFIPFILLCILMMASQGLYYGFFSIWLNGIGYSASSIGIFWMITIFAEVIALWKGQFVLKKISAPAILTAAAIAQGTRWLIFYFTAAAVPVIISQSLNAVSYGLFHIAALSFVRAHTPKKLSQTGISIYITSAFGIGSAFGVLVFGKLVEHFSIQGLFGPAGLISVFAGIAYIPFAVKEHYSQNPSYKDL